MRGVSWRLRGVSCGLLPSGEHRGHPRTFNAVTDAVRKHGILHERERQLIKTMHVAEKYVRGSNKSFQLTIDSEGAAKLLTSIKVRTN